MSNEFSDAIRDQMDVIDHALASSDTNLSIRPFAAARIFVEKCIVEIHGDTKENYLEKLWFAEIYQEIKKWYIERYGEKLWEMNKKVAIGLVSVYQTIFRVEIPLSTQEPAERKDRIWVCLPDKVQPLEWLVPPPNIKSMNPDEQSTLEDKVRWVANHSRELFRNINNADLAGRSLDKFAPSILVHLSRGADLALEPIQTRGLAVWEWHLAVEKSLKLLIRQNQAQPARTHDLGALCDDVENRALATIDRSLLKDLPSDSEANAHRYNEIPPPSSLEMIKVFDAALSLCCHATSHLRPGKLIMRSPRFLIQTLPWERQLKIDD